MAKNKLTKQTLSTHLDTAETQCVYISAFFIYLLRSTFQCFLVDLVHCLQNPQTFFFNKTFIKNELYSIIYTFKNYFATVFSVFNKMNRIIWWVWKNSANTISYLQLSFTFQFIIFTIPCVNIIFTIAHS